MITEDDNIHESTEDKEKTKENPDMSAIKNEQQNNYVSPSQEEVMKKLDSINKRYAKTFKKLAK